MTSKAERARKHKASVKMKPVEPRKAKAAEKQAPTATPRHEDIGLAWMAKRLSKDQIRKGVEYGQAWRSASLESPTQIASCLDDSGGGGIPSQRAAPGKISADAATRAAQGSSKLAYFDLVLGNDTDMKLVCGLICGVQHTPPDLVPYRTDDTGHLVRDQSAVRQIERTLIKALNLLLADERESRDAPRQARLWRSDA